MGLGKLDSYMQKMKVDHYLAPNTKINSKWIKDLNVRTEIIKTLEENIGSTLFDIGLSHIFLNTMSTQVRETKEKVNKWDYLRLKTFYKAKETTNKMERTHQLGENICKPFFRQGVDI